MPNIQLILSDAILKREFVMGMRSSGLPQKRVHVCRVTRESTVLGHHAPATSVNTALMLRLVFPSL